MPAQNASSFLGFDRNEYPGDQNLKYLRATFSYAGYWLNNPPGTSANTWPGKRAKLEAAGFGFLVLFNGRLYRELGSVARASELGEADAQLAVKAAIREGFPAQTIIFLDQEEGGRLLPEQKAYLLSWVDGVRQSGFRAGVYCSGIAAREKSGDSVMTTEDVRRNAGGRDIAYWVTNDACPPSPGCAVPRHPRRPVRVEWRLRMSGSSHSLLAGRMWPLVARAVTPRMGIVMRPERVQCRRFMSI
jgi:hypothetical protein